MFSWTNQTPLAFWICLWGALTGLAAGWGTRRALRDLELPSRGWPIWFGLAGAVLAAAFVWCVQVWQTQSTPEVIPDGAWRAGRMVFHLTLIALLLIITATDLRSYYILDWCCRLGLAIGIGGAVVSGQFQLAHVWVDWTAEIPQLRGPDIPTWLAAHPHWHGLAWSLAGALCGAISTGMVRWIGSAILGIDALGAGDVWLMAMVGAYLGWQPTLVIVLLAPLLALGVGGLERLRGNRAALPYGPFLALASVLVLTFWRWIWMAEFRFAAGVDHGQGPGFAIRRFFGDPIALLLVLGGATVLLVLLLGLLRLYKSLPTRVGR